ncbi:hypothetical protein ASPWEDRAFT_112101 [Aspergillus wentii DTO 134E9]|uniref:Histidine kinase n=1 Tax=Aspergillus wentii DTO 134E9 TaxID=1073089 RepID=A0A1L9RMK2_ASPWE|nr:uncharacterized protein ASPWEDRAFT_112101 [Aspergillus wentii DTO 134E9]OJJ36048.1 hypothetical protein ASPWEDRAFT_112101 [Aspergillus wentii DTO 134E9]
MFHGNATLSTDITLTALAQLGVYRFNCNRSFVTLIDSHEKQVLAEATASISLRNERKHASGDGLYMGITSLSPNSDLFSRTVKLSNTEDKSDTIETQQVVAQETSYVACDLSQMENFEGMSSVDQWSHIRFYAEVPLHSPSGSILGTFCIIDNKPRTAFGGDDIASLQEIADSIAHHLETSRIARCHSKADRLMNGLTRFSKGRTDSKGFEDIAKDQLEEQGSPLRGSISDFTSVESHDTTDRASVSTAPTDEVSPFFQKHGPPQSPGQTPVPLHGQGFFNIPIPMTPLSEKLHDNQFSGEERTDVPSRSTFVSVSEASGISQRLASVFSRASDLLRECMELDGVAFLDAARRSSRSSDLEGLPKAAHSGMNSPQPASLSSDGFSENSERLCEPLGFSVVEDSNGAISNIPRFGITESLLRDMLIAFPHGQVFNFEESSQGGYASMPTQQEICTGLAEHLPEAKSALFLPLWDWNKSHWLAGAIMWTRDSERPLGMEELHYLKVFGDSIIAEVARVDWASTEKSKSDFILSVSHELRSPLHGMLASAELLQSTPLQPGQQEMVKMVETCGLTLLDTMNYLLDFTKINHLTASRKKNTNGQLSRLTNLVTVFDLDALIEDVTNSLYAGHQFPKHASQFGGRYLPAGFGGKASAVDSHISDALSVIVRFEDQKAWKMESVSGAWRRIVMNLVGNALKFTKAGLIEISLSRVERCDSKPLAHLSVKDTGRGISPDFLEDKLFTPFSQEDILSEGVGLGLSIVDQLVTYLGGHIDVESELGVGTKVDVYIPVQMVSAGADPSPTQSPPGKDVSKVCLVGFNGYLDLKESHTGTLTAQAKRKLATKSFLSDVFLTKPGWTVSFADSFEKASGDIAVIDEATLKRLTRDGAIHTQFKTVVVLGGYGVTINASRAIANAEVIQVAQPLGPRKIFDTLKTIPTSPRIESMRSPALSRPSTPGPLKSTKVPYPYASALAGAFESPPMARENLCEFPTKTEKPVDHKTLHVLVVDDNDINMKILATFMRKIGCSYETATNGLIALEKYQNSKRRFDYVLMDLSMPVMDGIISSTKIREYEQQHGLPRTTIMAVTGVASATMQEEAYAAGIDDYLVKPISLHELKRIMKVS